MLKYVILLHPDSLALTQLLNLETKIANQDEMGEEATVRTL